MSAIFLLKHPFITMHLLIIFTNKLCENIAQNCSQTLKPIKNEPKLISQKKKEKEKKRHFNSYQSKIYVFFWKIFSSLIRESTFLEWWKQTRFNWVFRGYTKSKFKQDRFNEENCKCVVFFLLAVTHTFCSIKRRINRFTNFGLHVGLRIRQTAHRHHFKKHFFPPRRPQKGLVFSPHHITFSVLRICEKLNALLFHQQDKIVYIIAVFI